MYRIPVTLSETKQAQSPRVPAMLCELYHDAFGITAIVETRRMGKQAVGLERLDAISQRLILTRWPTLRTLGTHITQA